MELLSEIQNRATIRQFSQRPVEKEALERILDAGILAPSAKNRQPWRFIVLTDPQIKETLKDAAYGDERFVQAPVAIAACTTNIGYRMPNGELSYPIDIAFAVSFMMLQAEHEQLGTSLITTFQDDVVKNLLTIPYSMKVVMFLLTGYPESRPDREVRLPRNRVVAYDHW